MKLLIQPPKKTINKAFLKIRPLRSEIELFKSEFISLLNNVDLKETEEFNKNLISDFLKKALYPNYFINTKGRQDLVIHNGNDNKTTVGVIIEAKRPANKAEWFTAEKPNGKAIHELVLYYLRERIEHNNIDIKYVIATNIYEWYIFEASYFEKFFYKNKTLIKNYLEWRDGKKVTKDTSLFYNEIVKPFIAGLQEDIPCTYFNIQDYVKAIKNVDKADDRNLIALLKILSPQHLLKASFANDSNELDQNFYKELLHIIGLEDAKENGKNIIRRKKDNKNPASLLEMAISKLKTKGVHKVNDIKVYGDTIDEQFYNIALELCITWINRILFLKLLEGQLISYHKGDKSFRFLNTALIHDFDELFKLFHNVLAVDIHNRDSDVKAKYKLVPYLNSSLFEISELEDMTISIDSLDNSEGFELLPQTILKDIKRSGKTPKTLDYLFNFLDAYDFASEGSENIQEDNKPLINASVLGKVFEKINAYKDGSIYTPGFVTMYMCKQSLRTAILQKFNYIKGWNVNSINELYNKIEDTIEANSIINSLRICDPAVGSGHFLVSALNEIIAIKSELNILVDKSGKRLKEYTVEVENDELYITDEDGEIFHYFPKSKDSQRVQETLFIEKQTIIENCLFGVDINPNSVKICRLRLWIELLKNAYYRQETNYEELETLPNIDINIKQGNSLLSRFTLDADLSKALKSVKYNIKDYRDFVNSYKNEKSKQTKKNLEKVITTIKEALRAQFFINSKENKELQSIRGQYLALTTARVDLFGKKVKNDDYEIQKTRLEKRLETLEKRVNDIKMNVVYKNAFEWRFEFPEVLNNNGDYEGFDLIIGNPPYISAMELKKALPELTYKQLKKDYVTAKGTVDLFIYFFELGLKLLKENSPLAYITPNRYLSASYGEALREYIYKRTQLVEIVDYSHVRVFKEASTYPVVTFLQKHNASKSLYPIKISRYNDENAELESKLTTSEKLNFLDSYIWGFLLNEKIGITEKVIAKSVPITKCAFINATSTAAEADDYHQLINLNSGFKLINTGTIDPYESLWGKSELTDKGKKFITPYLRKDNDVISGNRLTLYSIPKIILSKIAISTEAFYDVEGEYASINTNCFYGFSKNYNPKYILAWLNSKLFQYTFECFFEGLKMAGGYLLYSSPNLQKMFIKEIALEEQSPFVDLVEKIMQGKKLGNDTEDLEKKIDVLFYNLYDLNKDEIAKIEKLENPEGK